jgi:hypothetical protein
MTICTVISKALIRGRGMGKAMVGDRRQRTILVSLSRGMSG